MEPFIGMITMGGWNFAPRGWAFCEGQLLPISQNQALFSLLGTNFGGDGRTTFGLPDFRGRVPIHHGTGPGLSPYRLGQKGGTERTTLTINEMPSHNHTATATSTADSSATSTLHGESAVATSKNPNNKMLALSQEFTYASPVPADNKVMAAESIVTAVTTTVETTPTVAPAGRSQPFDQRQPYEVVSFCIALQGIFPSRN